MCITFHLVENPFFINFLKTLNPGYPPSRKALSSRLLDNEWDPHAVLQQLDNE